MPSTTCCLLLAAAVLVFAAAAAGKEQQGSCTDTSASSTCGGGGDNQASLHRAKHNVMIWSSPRTGSSVLLNSLGATGYWRDNTWCEPLVSTCVPQVLGVPAPFPNGYRDSMLGYIEDARAAGGSFVMKEHATVWMLHDGAPSKYKALFSDPTYKHVFTNRDLEDNARSIIISAHKNGLYPENNPLLRAAFAACGWGVTSEQFFTSRTTQATQLMLLRYITEVLGNKDNVAIINLDDIIASPEETMRDLADFLEVPWTDKFVRWNGLEVNVSPVWEPWFTAINSTTGFVPMHDVDGKGGEHAQATPRRSLGDLPYNWQKMYVDLVERNRAHNKEVDEFPVRHIGRKQQ